ncbi:YjbE family putative metal transport protein [Jeongeupella avenae]|uniref:YjbE family putative metal transport protein n=2 Tax=Antarcticirhabdus aurantiaca TaxID=2606717 RepID=A0ACD4NXF8_9HYPH|nr:YjbE family putative metal transport protein [Jeongeuplla avenae]
MIDLVLAGDNALVIGLAVAGLAREQRSKAILAGIAAATVLRIVLALSTQALLGFGGALLVGGGLLLLYVCWRMWRELRASRRRRAEAEAGEETAAPKSLAQAVRQIVVADVSMSLDNVLAVAGAAGGHQGVLVVGLVLSIALMGLAASFIARLLQRMPWIAYLGVAIILYVAVEMILKGIEQLWPGTVPSVLV